MTRLGHFLALCSNALRCVSVRCGNQGKSLSKYSPTSEVGNPRTCAHSNQPMRVEACMAWPGVLRMKALLTVDDLSDCIHKSVTSIRSDVTRNPLSLPPICRLPGTKRLLWRAEDVECWLADHVSGFALTTGTATDEAVKAKPGRPTKSQQIRKQKTRLPSSGSHSSTASVGV
ncbi:hypothetical protein D3C85_983080 [compost metagenome]